MSGNLIRGTTRTQPATTAPLVQSAKPQNWWDSVASTIGGAVNNLVQGSISTGQKVLNTAAAGATGLETLGQAGLDRLTNNQNYQTNLNANASKLRDYLTRRTVTGDQGAFLTWDQAQNKNNDMVGNFVKPILSTAGEVAPMVLPYGAISKAVAPLEGAVASRVTTGLLGNVASKAARYGAEAGIVAPISAGVNTLHQYGTTGTFDPTKAITTGLQAGAFTAAGGLAGDLAKPVTTKLASIPHEIKTNALNEATQATGVKMVPTSALTSYEGAPSRTRVDFYKNKIQNGEPVKPIVAMHDSFNNLGIEDGKHRFQAYKELGIPSVPVKVADPGRVKMAIQNGSVGLSFGGKPEVPKNDLPIVGPDLNGTKQYVKEMTQAQKKAAKNGGSLLSNTKKEFATKGIDALSAIEKPVEKAAGGRENTVSLRNQLDRSLRSDTIAGQYAKDNGLHTIINGVKNTKAFDQYLIAKHAVDLENNGIKTGRDLTKDAQLTKDLSPQYEAQSKALTNYNHGLLDKTVKYGLVSPETGAYLKQKYPNYVPFDRIFTKKELDAQQGNGSGPASLSTQTVIQRIKGSDRQIHSPLESILSKTHDVVAQGERNLAAKEIIGTKDLPGNPLSLKEIKPGETIGNRSTVSFIDNGQKRTFETIPEVAQAAKSLNKVQLGLIGKILSYPTRALRLGATGVNLPFAASNIVKDAASSFINSSHPLRASVANPKVFLQALSAAFHHGGKSYGELVREGAGGTSFDIARNAAKDTVKKIRAERNPVTKVAYTVTHPGALLRAVEDTIGRSEEFGRAIQYFGNKGAALKSGKTSAEATAYGADAARNNTVNFARAGEYGRVLNSVLPYFNAGIQGSRTLLRNLRDRPLQTASKIAIASSIPVAATTAWNINDPKRKAAYDDIQDYEKQGNIIIVPPNPVKDPQTGRWNVIKIPVSQEIANLNNVVRNGVEAMQGDKSIDFGAMVGDLTGTVTSLNAQNPRQLLGQITPQAIKPGIEALTNQNLFTGNPIIPDKMKNLDAKDQYGANTSAFAKNVGGATNTSPFVIDNTIKTAFGGAGQTLIGAKPLDESIANRFTSAQGQSAYAPIDKAIKDNLDKLKATQGYKNMSSADKAKAITRLQDDVITANKQNIDATNGTGQYAPGYTGKTTKLSTRQAGLLDGKTDVSSYLTTQPTSSTTPKTPADKYKAAQDKYMSDTAAGKLSPLQSYETKQSLAKQAITSKFPAEVTQFYNMSKTQQDAYFATDKTAATDLYNQAKAMDSQLLASGMITSSKFKVAPGQKAPRGRKTSSTGASKGRYSYTKGVHQASLRNLLTKSTIKLNKIKVPKAKV